MDMYAPQIWCSCGQLILSEIGDGFVVTPDRRQVWMRRRTDAFKCDGCGHRYDFFDLQQISPVADENASSF
jgi:hypothetical protein